MPFTVTLAVRGSPSFVASGLANPDRVQSSEHPIQALPPGRPDTLSSPQATYQGTSGSEGGGPGRKPSDHSISSIATSRRGFQQSERKCCRVSCPPAVRHPHAATAASAAATVDGSRHLPTPPRCVAIATLPSEAETEDSTREGGEGIIACAKVRKIESTEHAPVLCTGTVARMAD